MPASPGDDDPDRPARRQDGFLRAVAVRRAAVWRATTERRWEEAGEGVGHMAAGRVADARPGRGVLREDRARHGSLSTWARGRPDHADRPVERLCVAARRPAPCATPGRMAAPKQPPLIALRTKVASAPATKSAASPAKTPHCPAGSAARSASGGRNGAMAAGSARSLIAFALPFHAPSTSRRTPQGRTAQEPGQER
jgi:hypothetical protein